MKRREFVGGLAAAAGLAGISDRVAHWSSSTAAWRVAGVLLTVAVASLLLRDVIRLHPYQTTYYSAFAGGVAGAAGR